MPITKTFFLVGCLCGLIGGTSDLLRVSAHESIWLEAEHLDGIRGYCWPMGKPPMKKTDGHWSISGPGWAAEWNQGGESGFLSIATGADDDRAVASKSIELPEEGQYFVWVRYGDWREKTEPFEIHLEQAGSPRQTLSYGQTAVIDEDNEMKLYWGWSFAWDRRTAELKKGNARLSLVSTSKAPEPRQIDVILLTTDPKFRPLIKNRPASYASEILNSYRHKKEGGVSTRLADLEPLTRKASDAQRANDFDLPHEWKLKTFRDQGFLYLWNCTDIGDAGDWLGDDPQRILYPYNVGDKETLAAFKKKYGGQKDVPIFSDPRVVPTFHGAGAGIFFTDPKTGQVNESGLRFAKWLDAHPERRWGMMMNYHPGKPIRETGVETFTKYRDRYVGSIAGESLGYFYPKAEEIKAATAHAQTRRQLADAITSLSQSSNAAKYRAIYGRDLDANPFEDVISCMSVGNMAFAPLLSQWGCRTLGYESASITSSVLSMRWAFMRGVARQGGHQTATYRSSNFGDSATIFSNAGSFHTPQNIYDNYYSVYSGAGMTWYKMDLWYQYMAGASMFYHEQGFDEFWRPGGTTAAGIRDVELSPKGKLVERFLRVTADTPDRGHPYTPIALLVDYAHGWEPAPYWPNAFKNWHQDPDKFRFGDHERMLEEYFWTAFHPIRSEAEKPTTGTNEVFLPGVFGDLFDVVCASPDIKRWRTLDTYPVVIVAGEIEVTAAEGKRLAEYIERGGTLLIADAHLTGPGVAALNLPKTGSTEEDDGYTWHVGKAKQAQGEIKESLPLHLASQRYRFKPIQQGTTPHRVLAESSTGEPICISIDRGAGRLIYLSLPHGLGIDRRVMPVVPQLFAHLSRGLMPVEVEGDVEWLVNCTEKGWLVTLLNPAGQLKPQQGITPTDYRENRHVVIHTMQPIQAARDRLQPEEKLAPQTHKLFTEVLAGSVRVIELQP